MNRETQAQIARVIFEEIAAGHSVSAGQRNQLMAFLSPAYAQATQTMRNNGDVPQPFRNQQGLMDVTEHADRLAWTQPDRTCRYCDMPLTDAEAKDATHVCASCAKIKEAARSGPSEIEVVYSYLLVRFRDALNSRDDDLRGRLDAAIRLFEELWPEDCDKWRAR